MRLQKCAHHGLSCIEATQCLMGKRLLPGVVGRLLSRAETLAFIVSFLCITVRAQDASNLIGGARESLAKHGVRSLSPVEDQAFFKPVDLVKLQRSQP